MKLYDDIYDAKEALDEAYYVMQDDDTPAERKLLAMLKAFCAERSIEVLYQDDLPDGNDPGFWLRRHSEVEAFRKAYLTADAAATTAANTAYLQSMKVAFEGLPEEIGRAHV